MKKKYLALFVCLAAVLSLIACSGKQQGSSSKKSGTVDVSSYAPINFNSGEVFGISPSGEKAGSLADVQLTDAEKEQIRKGNFTAAFCYHQLDNQVNQSKLAATRAVLADLNIRVLSVTDAQSNPDKLVNDLETTLALKPNVLFSMPYDPDVTAAVYRKYVDAGIKIVFMENTPTGFSYAKGDYVTMTNSDSYGNGKYAADIMARELGYEGEVAVVFFNADFFTTNERDRAFRETMAAKYPNIKIVGEYGFTSIDVVGASADALFAAHPKIDGVYASWDIPAEDVMVSAQAIGRNDLIITAVDLGDNSATLIAKNGIMRGVGCPKATETGTIEGLAAGCGLIGKKIPAYIVSASQPVARDNVLEAYKSCFNVETPKAVVDAYNSVK
ncbi:sugar ABC transporter substrate-binding protein [Spirochaetia bacterium]|nr:sugar ABC transporter substrate-binding protein [Spirochaetia bacterium]